MQLWIIVQYILKQLRWPKKQKKLCADEFYINQIAKQTKLDMHT